MFWQRHNNRDSFDKELLSFDLLFQLAYMSAIAASGISRNLIFDRASKLPVTSSRFFKEIHILTQKMGYDYPEACRLVGEATKEDQVKSLLLRLSSSLASGEAETDFLARETKIQAESYGNEYERKLESLRKWTDAYISLIISAAIIIVVAVVSMLIYSVTTMFIMGLVAVMIGVSMLGAWIIYRSAPREIKTLSPKQGFKAKLSSTLVIGLIAGDAVLCTLLALKGIGVGWVFLVGGAILLPIGAQSIIDDRKIEKRDSEVSTFLRSLGSVATAIGTTVREALGRIDLRSMGTLAKEINRLRTRLFSRLNPDLCWNRFVSETGSELVNRSVTMFQDATNLGGEPEEVGSRSSLLGMKVSLLRAKRRLVSSTFGYLALVMHGAAVALLVFIIEVVNIFGQTVQNISLNGAGGLTMIPLGIFNFDDADMQLLRWILIPVIMIMSVANAWAPKAAEGGHNHKFFFFLGVTLAISGLVLLTVPELAKMIFAIVPD
ncbi:MAG: archaellar assembly protein FlaJ [Chloroflexi bacterium]|nr:archaellar assembly protein FlaJ [Chloroflexota bacterium]